MLSYNLQGMQKVKNNLRNYGKEVNSIASMITSIPKPSGSVQSIQARLNALMARLDTLAKAMDKTISDLQKLEGDVSKTKQLFSLQELLEEKEEILLELRTPNGATRLTIPENPTPFDGVKDANGNWISYETLEREYLEYLTSQQMGELVKTEEQWLSGRLGYIVQLNDNSSPKMDFGVDAEVLNRSLNNMGTSFAEGVIRPFEGVVDTAANMIGAAHSLLAGLSQISEGKQYDKEKEDFYAQTVTDEAGKEITIKELEENYQKYVQSRIESGNISTILGPEEWTKWQTGKPAELVFGKENPVLTEMNRVANEYASWIGTNHSRELLGDLYYDDVYHWADKDNGIGTQISSGLGSMATVVLGGAAIAPAFAGATTGSAVTNGFAITNANIMSGLMQAAQSFGASTEQRFSKIQKSGNDVTLADFEKAQLEGGLYAGWDMAQTTVGLGLQGIGNSALTRVARTLFDGVSNSFDTLAHATSASIAYGTDFKENFENLGGLEKVGTDFVIGTGMSAFSEIADAIKTGGSNKTNGTLEEDIQAQKAYDEYEQARIKEAREDMLDRAKARQERQEFIDERRKKVEAFVAEASQYGKMSLEEARWISWSS